MRIVSCCCLLMMTIAPALADTIGANTDSNSNTNSPPFSYRSSGTCVASPEGFNARMEPTNSGVAWSTTFTSRGSVDDHGAGSEVGEALDTASFGAGPRMHSPAAHAYSAVFTAVVGEPAEDGSVTLHVGPVSGTFSAGSYAGQSFSLSGFDLKKIARDNGVDVYGDAPVMQTMSLGGGKKFERICILTVTTTPGLQGRATGAPLADRRANP